MKIVSTFTDFYDDVPNDKLRPVYHRKIVTETDIERKYKKQLVELKIGAGMANVLDLNIADYRTNTNSYEYVEAIPKVIGIGGKLHYCVAYTNSVLGIRRVFYDYLSLARFYRHPFIERSFKIYNSGVCMEYCFAQFKAVNFIMWSNSGKINIIKEPAFGGETDIIPLTKEYIYSTIESFLLEQKEKDEEYKGVKPTRWVKDLKKRMK